MMKTRLLAIFSVLLLFALIWRYVLEFPHLSNTIGVRGLLIGSLAIGLLLGAGALYGWRHRFTPWKNHLPEVFSILFVSVLFMPLFVSLLNRSLGQTTHQSFEFVSEMPYLASAYGIMKGEKIKPTGYLLTVREGKTLRRFRYKQQSYYPITQPGEKVLLPIRKGLLGFREMTLR